MTIDLTKLTPVELRNLLNNARKRSRSDIAETVVREMVLRGIAKQPDLAVFQWNVERVRSCLAPFRDVAKKVEGNTRTAYTDAGGLKIGRKKTDPDWKWVDSYSAIKVKNINAVFVCHIDTPGADPLFYLDVDGAVKRIFRPDQLDKALEAWGDIATKAQ